MKLTNGAIVCLRRNDDEDKLEIDVVVHKTYQVDSIRVNNDPGNDEFNITITTSFGSKNPDFDHTEYKTYTFIEQISIRDNQSYKLIHPLDHDHGIVKHNDSGGVIDPRMAQ